MKLSFIYLSVLSAFIIFISPAVQTQYTISTSVIGSGGGTVANDAFMVINTLGQPATGIKGNDNFLVRAGFWYIAAPDIITTVERQEDLILYQFSLEQNYPNPFNPSTTIRFFIPEQSIVTLEVYDLLGRKVATLIDDELSKGEHLHLFNAQHLSSGIYFYRLMAGNHVGTKRLMLVR